MDFTPVERKEHRMQKNDHWKLLAGFKSFFSPPIDKTALVTYISIFNSPLKLVQLYLASFDALILFTYNGDLNSGLVRYLNGQKLSDRQMVCYLNAI